MCIYSQIILLIQCSDWYRINPLEMVLLGCQTLADDSSASRDVSLITSNTYILLCDTIAWDLCYENGKPEREDVLHPSLLAKSYSSAFCYHSRP